MSQVVIKQVTPGEVGGMVGLMKDMKGKERERVNRELAGTVPINAGYLNGELAAIWGVIPPTLASNQAYLWVYTTDALKDLYSQFLFIRFSQVMVQDMLLLYESLVGVTEVTATKSIRWLKFLGAEYGEPSGEYIPFVIRRK